MYLVYQKDKNTKAQTEEVNFNDFKMPHHLLQFEINSEDLSVFDWDSAKDRNYVMDTLINLQEKVIRNK